MTLRRIIVPDGNARRLVLKAAQARRAFNRVSPVGPGTRKRYKPRRANYWARVYDKAKSALVESLGGQL